MPSASTLLRVRSKGKHHEESTLKRELKDYTPELLAKHFLNVDFFYRSSMAAIKRRANWIKTHGNEILKHFEEYGDLKSLSTSGLDSNRKKRLELILSKGFEEVREDARAYRERKIRINRGPISSTAYNKTTDKDDPINDAEWDDAVRAIEGD